MKLLLLFLTTLTTLSITFSYSASNVILANDATLPQLIKTPGKYTFIDFYADWCRHCKKLHPIVDQLGELFVDHPEIQIVKINGDAKDGRKMSKKYVELGYPTLLFIDNDSGRKVEFDGDRSVLGLSNFIQQLSGVRLQREEEEEEEEKEEEKEGGKHNAKKGVENITQGGTKDKQLNVLDKNKEAVNEYGDVVILTPETLESTIKSKPFAIISIGATWCNFCQDFKGTFTQLATKTFARDTDSGSLPGSLVFGQLTIDQFENGQDVNVKFDIKHYPTLLFFKHGDVNTPTKYTGDKKNYGKLVNAINAYTGLSRDISGDLKVGAGVIDKLSDKFSADMDPFKVLQELTESEKLIELNNSDDGGGDIDVDVEYYKLILESLIIDSQAIEIEQNRLEEILHKDIDKLNGITIDSIRKRQNILNLINLDKRKK